MLLNYHPGKDLPAFSASVAQGENDDPQDAGKCHLCQPGEEVPGRRDSILLLPLPGHIGVPLQDRLGRPLVVAVLSVEDDNVADLQGHRVGIQNVPSFSRVHFDYVKRLRESVDIHANIWQN